MSNPLPIATATISLGKPEGGHIIETVLEAAAQHVIRGIEMVYEHLEDLASRCFGSSSRDKVVAAATEVKQRCADLGLEIFMLQPFAYYEGLIDREKHREAIDRMRHWIEVAHALGTDTIQMPSNFAQTGITGDMDVIIADMVELADLTGSASPPVRIAYEAVAWGTFIDKWEQSWDVVKRVDRPNFGLCLDTFHIAGRVYGDPAMESGKNENAESDLQSCLDLMRSELDATKIFYVQLSDAEKLESPIVPGHDWYSAGDNSRMIWSRAARLFPGEQSLGGYLPISDVARTIVNDVGYRGWISMEIFSRILKVRGKEEIPDQCARRAVVSYEKIRKELAWDSLI